MNYVSGYALSAINVKGAGARGDGVTDDTTILQAAIDTGKAIYFPPGTYKITTALSFSTVGQLFYGDGMELSIIAPSGAINAFTSSGALVRCHFRDLKISGNSSTLNGIDCSSGLLYQSSFQNLNLSMGGKCIYAPSEFASQFTNVHVSSSNSHGMEVQGNSGTVFTGCYVHTISTSGKFGIVSYNGGTFIGLNSLDSGECPVLIGQAVAKGDATDASFRASFVGCNFEDFTKSGFRGRFNGTYDVQECTFFPPAVGTYDCSIYMEFCDQTPIVRNTATVSKGATRNKLAEIYHDAGAGVPLSINSYATWDNAGTLSTAPNVVTALAAFARYGMSVNELIVSGHLIAALPLVTGTVPVTAAASQIGLSAGTQTTIGANGAANALTANPLGYIKINVAGTAAIIPYYNA